MRHVAAVGLAVMIAYFGEALAVDLLQQVWPNPAAPERLRSLPMVAVALLGVWVLIGWPILISLAVAATVVDVILHRQSVTSRLAYAASGAATGLVFGLVTPLLYQQGAWLAAQGAAAGAPVGALTGVIFWFVAGVGRTAASRRPPPRLLSTERRLRVGDTAAAHAYRPRHVLPGAATGG